MDWPLLLRSALAHHQAGRLDEALAQYRSVLQMHPAQFDALRLLGVLLRQRGDLTGAREFLDLAMEVRPDSPEAHNDVGLVLFDRKDYAGAAERYQRALALKSPYPEALHNLGNAYLSLWQLTDAKSCYETALEQNSTLEESRRSLEWIRRIEGEIAAFGDWYRRATQGDGNASCGSSGLPASAGLFSRELLPHLLNCVGLTGSGAEVGVQSGGFSCHLLQHWHGRRLYSIDPWREAPAEQYKDAANVPQAEQDQLYRGVIHRLLPFENRSAIWRLASKEALEILPNECLDFCYLDADHSYRAVADEIRLWYGKLKRGGILSGHDYIPDGSYAFGDFGVQRAVNEFVREQGLRLFVTTEPQFPSWFVVKMSDTIFPLPTLIGT